MTARRRAALYGLLGLALAGTVALAWSNHRQPDYAHVTALLSAGRFYEGAAEIRGILAREGDSYVLESDLGFASLFAGDAAGAAAALRRALALAAGADPVRISQDRLYLARAYARLGRTEEAARSLVGALATAPDHQVPQGALGMLADLARRMSPATLATMVHTLAPRLESDPAILVRLGDSYSEVYQLEAAERLYRRAREIAPREPASYVRLSEILATSGRADEAERLLRDAMEVVPNTAPLHYSLGLVYHSSRRPEDALAEFARAVEREPRHADSHFMLARLYLRRGDERSAAEHLRTVLRLEPDRVDARSALASLDRDARSRLPARFALHIRLLDADGVLGRPLLAGNWDAAGEHDELGGWCRTPLAAAGPGEWTLAVPLPRWDRFQYNVLLFDEQGRARHQFQFAPPASPAIDVAIDAAHLNLPVSPPRPPPALPVAPRADGKRQVLVWMLDGGSWVVLRPLVERGAVPNIAALMASGASAPLFSPDPYTSRALDHMTRFTRDGAFTLGSWLLRIAKEVEGYPDAERIIDHDLVDFLSADEPSIWEFLARGHRSGVNLTFSDAWAPQQEPLFAVDRNGRRTPLGEHLDIRPVDTTALLDRLVAGGAAAANDPETNKILASYSVTLDAKTTLADAYLERQKPDLLFIVNTESDLLSHHLWNTYESCRRVGEPPSPAVAAYGETLERFYIFCDELLGRLLRRLDADDVVIVLSDHGMKTSFLHDPIGIFVAAGPGIRRGETLPTLTMLDVPPTLCHLTGVSCPVSDRHRLMAGLFTRTGAEPGTSVARRADRRP